MRSVVRFALCCAVVLPAPASAQGFFESLFGGPSLPRPPAPSQPLPPPVVSPYGYRTPLYSPYRNPYARDTEDAAPARTGAYRTLCVRMCDGFYWPISNSVPRSSFHRDANLCRASCGEEARLFSSTEAAALPEGVLAPTYDERYAQRVAWRKRIR